MLHVHGGKHVDAGIEQGMDILPTLGTVAAGNVGVGEFVDQRHGRFAAQHGVHIHLLELRAGIGDDAARNGFQAFGFGDGFRAGVRLEVRDDDVDALAAHFLGLFEHAIGLADAGGITEVDLEAPFVVLAHDASLCGNRRTSKSSAASMRRSTGLRPPHQVRSLPLWPRKI